MAGIAHTRDLFHVAVLLVWILVGRDTTGLLARLRRRRAGSRGPPSDPPWVDLARQTARARRKDRKGVKRTFAEHGLAVFDRQDDHEYVPVYFGEPKASKLRLPTEHREFYSLAREVRSHKRTSLYYDRLYVLFQAVKQAQAAAPRDAPIELLEVGVRKGGSSRYLAALGERLAPGRVCVSAVDTFEGHSAEDLPTGVEGTQRPGKLAIDYESVVAYLSDLENVDIIKGRIQDVAAALEHKRFSFVHVDVDIYEPTRFTLEFVRDRLAAGGMVIADDYGAKTCPGVRRAVDEFIAASPGQFLTFELPTGQCLLIPRQATPGHRVP